MGLFLFDRFYQKSVYNDIKEKILGDNSLPFIFFIISFDLSIKEVSSALNTKILLFISPKSKITVSLAFINFYMHFAVQFKTPISDSSVNWVTCESFYIFNSNLTAISGITVNFLLSKGCNAIKSNAVKDLNIYPKCGISARRI